VDRVLRILNAWKRDEVIGGSRKLYNKTLHNLCSSPDTDIITALKSMMLRREGYVACMGTREISATF
jgi:hypothetical protein